MLTFICCSEYMCLYHIHIICMCTAAIRVTRVRVFLSLRKMITLPLPFPTAVVLVGTMPDSTSIITSVAISQSQVESRK